MSTERFMSRICKSPGRFAFALLLGALLALPCLAPAAVFARASGQTGADSLSSLSNVSTTDAVLNKVGVSVVRLVATYGAAGTQKTCTGLGALIASESPSVNSKAYTNWVLTDGNLISTAMGECGVTGNNKLALASIDILASSEYANQQVQHLDTLKTCSEMLAQAALWQCDSDLFPGNKDTIINPQPGAFSYTLLSFQSASGQPYLGQATTTGNPLNVGLGTASVSVYPAKQSDGKENPADFLLPALVGAPATAPGASASVAISTNPIEGGTPEIDAQGQMVGMWMTNGNGGYLPVSSEMLRPILSAHSLPLSSPPTTSPQSCSVAGCWNQGIDAFNTATTAAQYTQAHNYLSQAYKLNQKFAAAHTFDQKAVQGAQHSQDQEGDKHQLTGLLDQYPWAIYAAAGLLVLLLLIVGLLSLRANRKRRELKKFKQEVEVSRRMAAEQVEQQRRGAPAQPLPPARSSCPNCHAPVRVTDSACPKCNMPLSPSASGLNVRLAGSAPRASAPLPPLAPALSPFADQPTMQILPGSPLPAQAMAEVSEPTLVRSQLRPEEAAQLVQQVRGRNLSLAVGTRTNPGIKRKHKPNEDSLFAARWGDARFGLFVVADGMGGHANGQDASRLAIQTIIDFMLPQVTSGEARDDQAFLKLLEQGVQAANQAVHARNMESHADMGTTMTAALVVGATAYVANVGDSRTYLYRAGEGLSKVTHDHSVVASLVDAGIIKPDDIYTHPKRNQIYRSLGEKPVVEVDTFPVNLRASDKLLLCSDGLWDMVRDPLIQDVLGKNTRNLDETGQNLIEAALNGGGEDNVSVIVVQLAEANESTGISGVQLLYKPDTVTFPDLTPR